MARPATGILFLIIVLIAVYWWSQSRETKVDPVLKSIVSTYGLGMEGRIYDPTDALGVHGVDDVSFTRNDKVLTIQYGKQRFKVRLDDQASEVSDYLSKLGLQIQKVADGQWTVKFNGEAVKQFE